MCFPQFSERKNSNKPKNHTLLFRRKKIIQTGGIDLRKNYTRLLIKIHQILDVKIKKLSFNI